MSAPSSLPRTILRWTARIGGGVLALVLVAAGAVYGLTERRHHATRVAAAPDHRLVVPTDAASIAEGERLATIRGCVDCHGARFGGRVMIDDPAFGRMVAPNVTRGGRGATLTDQEWELAVRHGLHRDGTPLLLMPATDYKGMADDELGRIVAYVRSLPPDPATHPAIVAGPMIRALEVANVVNLVSADSIAHDRPHVAHVTPAPTAEYGRYLGELCAGCHGPGLSGGKIPGTPPDWKPAANITPTGIGHYSQADFTRILREGRRPDGSQVDSLMPYKLLRRMNDTEIAALYAYLRTVPARPYGQR